MAVLKHIPSKNASYDAAIDYLMYKHDELSGKMIHDDDGNPIVRDDFLMDGVNREPFEYPIAAMETNKLYGKNGARNNVKSHHYVLSFDPRDEDVGLTFDEAHRMALKFAEEWFGAYQRIVFTHPEGHNESGNIHCHIVFCSVRIKDEPIRDWMTHRSEWEAGGKHHATLECHAELKQAVMDMCRKRNLHQVDLLSPAKERVTEREYWAQRRLEIRERLDAEHDETVHDGETRGVDREHRDEKIRESGHSANRDDGAQQQREHGENEASRERGEKKEPPSHYTTQKRKLRRAIRDAMSWATDFESFAAILKDNYGIEAKMTRGHITYKHPEREKSIRGTLPGHLLRMAHHRSSNQTAPRARQGASPSIAGLANRRCHEIERRSLRQQGPALQRPEALGIDSLPSGSRLLLPRGALRGSGTVIRRPRGRRNLAQSHGERPQPHEQGNTGSGAYLSNQGVWRAYRASPDRRAFYMAHRHELEACNEARKELKELFPDGEPPTLSELKAEKQRLVAERNAKYDAWTTERYRHRELETAKRNVDAILGDRPNKGKDRATSRSEGEIT